MSPLTIFCNARLEPNLLDLLTEGASPHPVIFSRSPEKSNLFAGPSEPEARAAEIQFGQPHPEDIIYSKALRWVHITSAGYARYDNDEIRNALRQRGAAMTNSSTVYADPCAHHLLAFMLAHARQIPAAVLNGATERGWPYLDQRGGTKLLTGKRAVIVGLGAIAHRLIELLAPFHMHLAAVRRNVRGDESIPTFTEDALPKLLPEADHVINILPAGSSSNGFFNAQRFAAMKPSAVFYNVGRGDTVDQNALIAALNSERLAAAYLDVTTPEPLPSDHPLWAARNCFITPHIAGGFETELEALVRHFLANLHRFDRGERLRDRIV
jgi:phosphoglycerate dehydrogenase-like enzyme